MTFSVILSSGVEEELEEAAQWIEEQRSGFGLKFIEMFEVTIENLSQYPYSYSIKFHEQRVVKIERFSYVLIYEVVGRIVVVTRLIHTSRRPAKRYYRR